MEETFEHLDTRLSDLKDRLSTQEGESIRSQLHQLTQRLSDFYKLHPEYERLQRALETFKLRNKVAAGESLDHQLKEEEILLHYDDIFAHYPHMVGLENMSYDAVLDKINHVVSTSECEMIRARLSAKQEHIRSLDKVYRILQLKSMLVCEKYVASLIAVNSFWIRMDEMLVAAYRALNKIEAKQREETKY
ncbi:uncharacterized protein LODBEIA_P13850 [Lodderomyces beijingensis]|uniref:Uncharacterized protein n=1 Tax=Lodderomyces beijingensis TaxID=1775926 RepID=A0ABP0ZJ49_9ASCO